MDSEGAQIRELLADEHAGANAGIRQFQEHAQDIMIVAEADHSATIRNLIEKRKPDVAVLDIQMPQATGIEVPCWVRANHLDVPQS